MPLYNAKVLLRKAAEKHIAVGAFNVANMEMVMGIIAAAEAEKTPIILQIAEVRLPYSPLHLMGPLMFEAARKSTVPIAVHLDHGRSMPVIKQALEYGFSSCMFDGSKYSLEENIEKTNECAAVAAMYGATLEAELGVLGGNEGEGRADTAIYTRPEDAEYFASKAKIDSLAVAIGNAHGNYRQAPKLQFDILEDIAGRVDVPLVLHGGTGISPQDFQKCISLGIRKINIATSSFDACTRGAARYFDSTDSPDYFGLNKDMVAAVCENTRRHLAIFNMEELK